MKIEEDLYLKMPNDIKILFVKLKNQNNEEIEALFPHTKSGKVKENKNSYNSESNTGFLKGKTTLSNQHGDSGSASRFFYCAKTSKQDRNEGCEELEDKVGGGMSGTKDKTLLTGSGNERNNVMKNNHPTVKPTKLMQYLIKMVTPENGIVLDPFMGSGSTGKACVLEDKSFIGIEMDEEYFEIAEKRINFAKTTLKSVK